tara:strand:+ start:477 stop:650 length:174 start_codon:yes stop_codon:yes gene_type:complete
MFDKRLIKSQEIRYFQDENGVTRKKILFRYHRAIPLVKKAPKKRMIKLFEEIGNAVL